MCIPQNIGMKAMLVSQKSKKLKVCTLWLGWEGRNWDWQIGQQIWKVLVPRTLKFYAQWDYWQIFCCCWCLVSNNFLAESNLGFRKRSGEQFEWIILSKTLFLLLKKTILMKIKCLTKLDFFKKKNGLKRSFIRMNVYVQVYSIYLFWGQWK